MLRRARCARSARLLCALFACAESTGIPMERDTSLSIARSFNPGDSSSEEHSSLHSLSLLAHSATVCQKLTPGRVSLCYFLLRQNRYFVSFLTSYSMLVVWRALASALVAAAVSEASPSCTPGRCVISRGTVASWSRKMQNNLV